MVTAMDIFHIWFDVSLHVSLDVSARMKKHHPTFEDNSEIFKAQMTSNGDWMERESLLSSLLLLGLRALWNTSHSDSFSLQSLAVGENRLSHLDAAFILCGDGRSLQPALKQTSAYEREWPERERTTVQTNNGSCSFFFLFFLFIAPSRCQPQQPLCPLWHPMAALLHHMKERRRGGLGSCRLGLGTWIQS